MSVNAPDKAPTVGILTALPMEAAAVRLMLDDLEKAIGQGRGARQYWTGTMPGEGGMHQVVVALMPDMGNNSAAIAATNLIHHFPTVKHLIMCGIAGGVPNNSKPEHDVRLGDVVVSDRGGVVQYDFIKEKPDGTQVHRYPPRPPAASLIRAFKEISSNEFLNDFSWRNHLDRAISNFQRPSDNVDAQGNLIEYPDDPKRSEGQPRLFEAPIAAANRLLKNPVYRDYLGDTFGVKAVEMEGAGIADAAWDAELAGYFVIRGICDYCDENKGDVWQPAAALAAAAFTRAILGSTVVSEVPL